MHIISIAGLNALAWTLCVLDILITFGRLYIRWRIVRKLQWDDALNGAALVALIGFVATYQVYLPTEYNAELYGLGLSDVAPTEKDIIFSLKMTLTNVMLFWIVIYLVKASFLALYWSLFRISPGFRKAWWAVAIYTCISFGAIFVATLWQCNNPRSVFDPVVCSSITQRLVINIVSFWCVLNVVGDLSIMALPLGMLRSLHMARSQKIGLAAIFTIVVIDIVFDILRTVYTASAYLSQFPDANAVWALCEPSVAVMVCALPSYRGLLSTHNRGSSTLYGNSDREALKRGHELRRATVMDDLSAYSLHSGTGADV